jgi:hypothetical protein
MKQELVAYLFRCDGHVSEMPTDELLSDLEQLRQAGSAQEPNSSADHGAVSAFLQTVKRAMRTGGTSVNMSEKRTAC